MAENLYSSQWLGSEVLHTNSKWITGSKSFSKLDLEFHTKLDIASAINECRSREEAVYQQYGCKNHSEFVQMVRQGFLESPRDAEVLKRFEQENIARHFSNLARTQMLRLGSETQENIGPTSNTVILKIDASKANVGMQKINKELAKFAGLDGELVLDINSQEFGKIVNAYRKSQGKKGSYRLTSVSDEKMKEIIGMAMDESISISINGKHPLEYYEVDVVSNDILGRTSRSFPWGLTKKDIKFALHSDKTGLVKRQLEAAHKTLKEFFTETLTQGGGVLMQQAAKIVWEEKIGDVVDENIGFFEKGNQFHLKAGASGEFAGAMLFNYLNLRFGKAPTARRVATIIGDDTSMLNVQGKADLMLFEKYGVQVKNLALNWRKSTLIDTNTSIHRIAQQSGENAKDLRIFLANYYFNKSFADEHWAEFNEFVKNLSEYMYMVYSFAVNDYIEEDTVNFYLIGGKYLVPSSEILASIEKRKTKETIPVNVPKNTQAKTDDFFKDNYDNYWTAEKRQKKTYWEPTNYNRQHFENIVGRSVNSKTVSITSNIDYSYFINPLEQGKFGLW